MTLLWPLFALLPWALTYTVVTDKTREGDALASVPSVGVGSNSHCCGGNRR